MERSATVYQRKGQIFCHSSSQTEVGVWLLSEPAHVVLQDDPDAIGTMVRDCLAHSRTGIPHPTDFRALFKPILDLAGVKSVTTFSNIARCVGVEQGDDGEIHLIPTRNGGKHDGFTPLEDRIIVTRDDGTLGAKVLEALEHCE